MFNIEMNQKRMFPIIIEDQKTRDIELQYRRRQKMKNKIKTETDGLNDFDEFTLKHIIGSGDYRYKYQKEIRYDGNYRGIEISRQLADFLSKVHKIPITVLLPEIGRRTKRHFWKRDGSVRLYEDPLFLEFMDVCAATDRIDMGRNNDNCN